MGTALQMGCLIAGILCLCYYLGILLYAGIRTSLSWLWAAGGILLLLLGAALLSLSSQPRRLLEVFVAAALLLIALAVVSAFVIGSRIVRAMRTVPRKGLPYVIVLGAQVKGSRPSRALLRRLDAAAAYAVENPGTVFILSGGQGPDEEISEALCMSRYLEEQGLLKDRLITEDRSKSTRENLEFSAELIGSREESIGILSNNFHICRALMLAVRLGFTDVSGIPASADPFMQPQNIMREICCIAAADLQWKLRKQK